MLQTAKQFDRRLGHITKEHEKASKGLAYKVSRSGLIVAKPRGFRLRFPFKGIAVLFLGLVLFKGFLLAYLGPGVYLSRLDILADGTFVEQAGAWALQIEPVTQTVANVFAAFGLK